MKAYLGRRNPERARTLVDAGIITREQACSGKVRHANRNLARAAAKGMFRSSGRKAAVYKCEFCDGYHATRLRHGEDE